MGGIAGCVGPEASVEQVQALLAPIVHRGAEAAVWAGPGVAMGLRFRTGRVGTDTTVQVDARGSATVCAGRVLGVSTSPAAALAERLAHDTLDSTETDGAFAAARWNAETETLTLLRDPFGVRALYLLEHKGALYFASELKQLLAVADALGFSVELDPVAVHKFLTFSFVPGEATPIAGIRRLLPGHRLDWRRGVGTTTRWFALEEHLEDVPQGAAAKRLSTLALQAVRDRVYAPGPTALALSGGVDSSAVGLWLRELGVPTTAFTLDFGQASVEREEARETAEFLKLEQVLVPADPALVREQLEQIVWHLDMPYGDAVTGPQWLLARAAKAAGFESLWNGEGGDQLFGGWTSKPMVAAAVFGTGDDGVSLEEQYLRSYHRFYGLEEALYAPAFADRVTPGIRRAVIAKFLGSSRAQTFLNRVRLTDLSLKGSQNILPRAGRMGAAHGLDVNMPLFDRRLAAWSFTLPTELKLKGACEKYVMKLALQNALPESIVWRRKFGMSVPMTDWVQGALRPAVETHLSDERVRARGLFRPEFVRSLREGRDVASETRRRRLGERLWALLVLEVWLRRFVDARGRAP